MNQHLKKKVPQLLLALALTGSPEARAQNVADERQVRAESEVVRMDAYEIEGSIASYYLAEGSTALKGLASLRETPFTVQVANEALLKDLRAESLADVYPYITGLSSSGTRADSFNLRGFASNRESVQVDGMPGSTTVFGSPPTANVERIEVLKGPASVLYGQLAPGGIVNIVTKKPLSEARQEIFASVKSFAGQTSSFGDDLSGQVTVDSTGPLSRRNNLNYRLIGRFETGDSFRQGVDFDHLVVTPSISWSNARGTSVLASLEYLLEEGKADQGLVAPGNDLSFAEPIDRRYQASFDTDKDEGMALALTLQHPLTEKDHLHIAWRSVWHNDQRTLFENNALQEQNGEPVLRRRFRDQYNERQYHFADVRWERSWQTGPLAHKTTFGLHGGHEQRWFDRLSFGPFVGTVSVENPQTDIPRPDPVPQSLRETWLKNYSAYILNRTTLGESWHFLGGLRYQSQEVSFESLRDGTTADQTTDATVPSVGLLREFGGGASAYFSYSESFIPASVEREDANGNTGLPPERAQQFEGGFKYESPKRDITASFALFQITRFDISENLGFRNINGNNAFGLVGEARSEGLEVDFQWQPVEYFQLRAGYSQLFTSEVTEAVNTAQVGAPLTNAPQHQGHLWARYNFDELSLKGWGLGVGLTGLSEREAVSTNDPTRRLTLPGYLRLDLAVYYEIGNTSLALNVRNLFDETIYESAGGATSIIPGEPRSLTLSVRQTF
jgi:iron complex outermembrane recepter protein